MAEDEDYELLPHREIQRLKEEISKLKGGESVDTDKELKRAVTRLAEKIESMNDILEAASQDLREEDKEAEIIKEKIDPIMEKMESLDEQNQKIARGLVAINDIVTQKLEEISGLVEEMRTMATDVKDLKMELRRRPSPMSMPRPSAPRPPEPSLPPGPTVPPPPEGGPQKLDLRPPKKRGLFG
jgi:chromosome segregation ATPase